MTSWGNIWSFGCGVIWGLLCGIEQANYLQQRQEVTVFVPHRKNLWQRLFGSRQENENENHKCCDCDKIIESGKELFFYPEQEISAAAERFLCEVCADFCAAAGRLEVDYRGLKSNETKTYDKHLAASACICS